MLSTLAFRLSCSTKEKAFFDLGCLNYSAVDSEGPMLLQMLTSLSRNRKPSGQNVSAGNVSKLIADHLEKKFEDTGAVPKEQVVQQGKNDKGGNSKKVDVKVEQEGSDFTPPADHLAKDQSPSNSNVTEQNAPFASVVYKNVTDDESPPIPDLKRSQKDVVIQVNIASSNDIICVYLILFVPLIMGWTAYFHYGQQESHYHNLLQLTFCATSLGNILINQSLCILMRAPMALTCIQAGALVVIGLPLAILQTMSSARSRPEVENSEEKSTMGALLRWSPAAFGFGGYQLADHLLSFYTSLSERTVFGNLTPVLSMLVEASLATFWASTRFRNATFAERMSVFGITVGVLVFALQYPDFNAMGVEVALLCAVMHLIYRMIQRTLLAKPWPVPTTSLVCYDGAVLFGPSLILSFFETPAREGVWRAWMLWTADPAIMIMTLLSCVTFFAGHWSAIMLLRVSSVTSALILTNLSNGLCVVSGIWFFGDSDFEQPLAFVGIIITILGSMSYSYFSAPSSSTGEKSKSEGTKKSQKFDVAH